MAKILILDIETAPNIAYVWGAWKQNVGHNQRLEKSHIMSYAAKWLGKDLMFYEENRKSNDKRIVDFNAQISSNNNRYGVACAAKNKTGGAKGPPVLTIGSEVFK